jgi:predicted ester cyclase
MTQQRGVATVGRRRMMLGASATAASLAAGLLVANESVAIAAESGANPAFDALLDRYLAAVNAHDTSKFPELFSEGYIQHSGRNPSGLQAQIANYQRIFENWPDFQSRIEDRIFGGDRIVARSTLSATHTKTVQGFAPTGKRVTWATIDIWRVENGKLAEHWDVVDIAGLQRQLRDQ